MTPDATETTTLGGKLPESPSRLRCFCNSFNVSISVTLICALMLTMAGSAFCNKGAKVLVLAGIPAACEVEASNVKKIIKTKDNAYLIEVFLTMKTSNRPYLVILNIGLIQEFRIVLMRKKYTTGVSHFVSDSYH